MCACISVCVSVWGQSWPPSEAASLPHWWDSRRGWPVRLAMVGWLLLSNSRKRWNIVHYFLFSLSPGLTQGNYYWMVWSQFKNTACQLGKVAQVCGLCSFWSMVIYWSIMWPINHHRVTFTLVAKNTCIYSIWYLWWFIVTRLINKVCMLATETAWHQPDEG